MNDEAIGFGCAFGWLAIMAAGAIGWILNVAKIVGTINDPISALLILRAVGVFVFPLGCVLGWF